MADKIFGELSRRRFLQGLALGSAAPVLRAADHCTGPQPRPPGDLPYSDFGQDSTAGEVTRGLDLAGLRVVITGCNSGLGYESMRVLAERGAQVIGTARTREKAHQACASIAGDTIPLVLELTDQASIRTCAAAINAMAEPIDVLMCNAGIMALPELELVNGVEKQFAVNHLGHFLFTSLLQDAVVEAPAGRIVILSSCAHFSAPSMGIDFDNLDGAASYAPWTAYGQSKLANGLHALALSRRLAGKGVVANAVHPGVIGTNLWRQLPPKDRAYDKSTPEGAATQCYAAVHPLAAKISGQYLADCNPALANPLMYDRALADRLWAVSEELTSG